MSIFAKRGRDLLHVLLLLSVCWWWCCFCCPAAVVALLLLLLLLLFLMLLLNLPPRETRYQSHCWGSRREGQWGVPVPHRARGYGQLRRQSVLPMQDYPHGRQQRNADCYIGIGFRPYYRSVTTFKPPQCRVSIVESSVTNILWISSSSNKTEDIWHHNDRIFYILSGTHMSPILYTSGQNIIPKRANQHLFLIF